MPTELTVAILGLAAAFIGWIGTNFIFRPIRDIRSAITAAYEDRAYYSNIYHNPGVAASDVEREGSDKLRRHAMRIDALRLQKIPFRRVWVRFGWLPTMTDLVKLKEALVFLSNSFGPLPPGIGTRHRFDVVAERERTIDRVAGREIVDHPVSTDSGRKSR